MAASSVPRRGHRSDTRMANGIRSATARSPWVIGANRLRVDGALIDNNNITVIISSTEMLINQQSALTINSNVNFNTILAPTLHHTLERGHRQPSP